VSKNPRRQEKHKRNKGGAPMEVPTRRRMGPARPLSATKCSVPSKKRWGEKWGARQTRPAEMERKRKEVAQRQGPARPVKDRKSVFSANSYSARKKETEGSQSVGGQGGGEELKRWVVGWSPAPLRKNEAQSAESNWCEIVWLYFDDPDRAFRGEVGLKENWRKRGSQITSKKTGGTIGNKSHDKLYLRFPKDDRGRRI